MGPGQHQARLRGRGETRPEPVRGVIGGALRFHAADEQFLEPDPPLCLPELAEFTAMAWVRPTQSKVAQELLCQKRDHISGGSDDRGWRLRYFWRSAMFELGSGSAVHKAIGRESDVKPGYWQHVAGVFGAGELRLYVNGVLLKTVPLAGTWRNSGLPLVIGNYSGTKAPYALDGVLDDVRLYDHAMTEDELVRVAAKDLPR